MPPPQLTVSYNGLGATTAELLNTFEQTCDTAAQLAQFTAISGMQVYIRGLLAPADGGQGVFYWNATSSAPDDGGITVLNTVNNTGLGRWLRLPAFVGAGTKYGLAYFNTTTSWASLSNLGTSTQVLHGNAGGPPTWGLVNLATDVTGSLTTANLPVSTAAQVIAGTNTATFPTPKALADANAIATLTDAPTISWDMSQGVNAIITLGGNRTLLAPTNFVVGRTYNLQVLQDATGSRLMTWNTAYDWGTAGAPTLTVTANKIDLVTMFCASAAPTFMCYINKGF